MINAVSKNIPLNLSLFISYQMSYNFFEVWGFRPFPHLRACIKLANPAKNAPNATSRFVISFIRLSFFFFFLFSSQLYISSSEKRLSPSTQLCSHIPSASMSTSLPTAMHSIGILISSSFNSIISL